MTSTPPGKATSGAEQTPVDDDIIDPVWSVYFDGRPFEINRPVGGFSLREWRNGDRDLFKRILTPDSLERVRSATRTIRSDGRPVHNLEIALNAKNGRELHHFLVNYRPILDDNGLVVGMRGEARNITDLRTASGDLGKDIQLLATLISHSPDIIWVFYFDGRAGYVNRGCGGFGVRDWRKEGLAFFRARLAPDSLRRFDRAVGYIQNAGESVRNIELDFRARQNNVLLRLLGMFAPLFDTRGVVYGVYSILHDVTDITLTRAALNRSEGRFEALIENAHDLVWITDRNGRMSYVNRAAGTLYGCDPNDLIGRPFLEITHPDHREKDWRAFQDVMHGKSLTLHETVHLRSDGANRYLSFNVQPRLDDNWEVIGAMGIARDVTDEKIYQRQLEHLADHDQLTGLYNRHYFENELSRVLQMVARGVQTCGLLYIDIDNFKYVNDMLGHAAGDKLLLQVAQLLLGRLRQGDVLARFGGDEFTVMLQHVPPELLRPVAESFQKLFKGYTYVEGDRVFDIRISVGATLLNTQTTSIGDALAQADLACSLAKQRGRNQTHLYDPADQSLATMATDMGWSRKINSALEHERFELHFQSILHIPTGAIEHYEVLIRLRDADGELVLPGAFLPAAERFGLIHALDRWVVRKSVQLLADNSLAMRLAINLSGRVFEDNEFLSSLQDVLRETGLDPSLLILEITETAAISQMAAAREFIAQLKLLGCQVSLDDFGSGFSSYSYLKYLPIDYLKIDGSFVQQLAREPVDQAIVRSMNQVAHALGCKTIAEFVEDETTLALLRAYGVDYAQGYYFGKPSPHLIPDGG